MRQRYSVRPRGHLRLPYAGPVGWLERVRKASAGQRVTRVDQRQGIDTVAELNALNADRERLLREGLVGVATIVGIRENVATTGLGIWHELELDVQLPDRDSYRATRRVALQLSTAPHIAVGAQVPVRVDPRDRSTVLVVVNL
jgi:hypothetical protein